MTAKEYLSQAAVLKRRIKQLEDRVEEIRTEVASPKAIRYDKDMIQSSPSGDALANYMIRLEKEEQKLIRCKEQYLDKYEEIRNRIIKVMPGIYSDILFMRYLRTIAELNRPFQPRGRITDFLIKHFIPQHRQLPVL